MYECGHEQDRPARVTSAPTRSRTGSAATASQLDHCLAQERITGLRDALVTLSLAAIKWDGREPGIGCNFLAGGKRPEQRLMHQDRSRLSAEASRPGHKGDFLGIGILWHGRSHRGVALGLDNRDLLQHQVQPLELALEFATQPRRQFVTIAGAQLAQTSPAILAQEPEVVNALAGEYVFDMVDVLHALGNQQLTLAVRVPGILPLYGGHLNHVAGSVVAKPSCLQGPQQHCGIELLGLGVPSTAIDLKTARIPHLADEALGRSARTDIAQVVRLPMRLSMILAAPLPWLRPRAEGDVTYWMNHLGFILSKRAGCFCSLSVIDGSACDCHN